MIFSNHKIQEIPFIPKIYSCIIERKIKARFLGIIIHENLTWRDHILAVKAKMSRYVGLLYKLKSILPISIRKNIFQSFVQSHLNYCPIVWGLGPKSSIEPLFAEQKKAMRALMPGYTKNFYHKGITPCHTKPYFTNYNILTVHSIIITNILIFMYKYYNSKHHVPPSVASIISLNAPKHKSSQENDNEWFKSYPIGKYRNVISFKGPLFYKKYITDLENEHKNNGGKSIRPDISINCFKTHTKTHMLKIQSEGQADDWEGQNMPLYQVPGIKISSRNTDNKSYIQFFD